MVLTAALGVGELFAGGRPPRDERAAARTVEAFRRLLAQREARGGDPFPPTDPIAKAHRYVLHAEIARAFGSDDERRRWWDLEYAVGWAGENWVMALGTLHWAEALVVAGAPRAEVAVPLRRAHRRACESGYKLIRERAESLGRRVRVTLDGAAPAEPPDGLAILTAREREVLDLLTNGRSYADIARELFISQKTVGVHVSHVLQKTGTGSRAEAAAWAWQHGLQR
jgi:DNA-binding CsgD family transcriptional regulator